MTDKARDQIFGTLERGGYHFDDIRLAQSLSRKALETHYDLGIKIRSCNKCSLCNSPLTGTGPWNSPLMIVGGVPGTYEDRYDIPFIGAEGVLLTIILAKAKVDRNSLYLTYALKCPVPDGHVIKPSEIQTCRYHLVNEIKAVSPEVILTIGEAAMAAVRNTYTLDLNKERNQLHTIKTAESKTIQVVHTHSFQHLTHASPDQSLYKNEVWADFNLAIQAVKKKAPHYNYDRNLTEVILP